MTVITKPTITAEALFDQISEAYEDAYGGNEGLRTAFARLNDYHEAGSSVLDIGCGPGGPASRLIKAGFQVTGIDISQKMVDFCQKSFPGTFHKADMTKYEPSQQFDAIVSLFNLFQASYTTTYSMVFKMASWLRPGGTLILGTIAAEDYIQDKAALSTARKHQYIENYDANFMGRVIPVTFLTMSMWLNVVQQAGLFIQVVDRCDFEIKGFEHKENHLFITARKMKLEPLFGPYPLPTFRRRPHLLSEGAWKPFAERLTRHEFDAVLKAVESNKEVLDIGSGHGELPVAIAKQLGKAYAIEPNGDRNEVLTNNSAQSSVKIRQGTAEKLPFEDNKFDAAVALWILHYVDDLEQSLTEMTRVVDATAPNARIVIVQGAPDNEVVNLINKACAPIAQQGMLAEESSIDHQGFLLATAARVFATHGFGNISVARVDAHCNFPEEDLSVRCTKAADVLTDFWYKDHPRNSEMKEAFQPVLKEHFANRPLEVGDQAVILIAKPTVRQ
ncbi:hypothetical protein H112_04289 [Trichophyton rubrum D6]|uniref:Methyltransferase type 11 domain-containing protein n=2 Tax=Trichophyton rubrum TaxID=5551 RepID=F2SPR7_TRIRC|nr:uncharacterized protein TERG_04066 [Trichophyton rubrum CBS 118892]EZF22784.1 hypothetical protein H100_04296 [Trichophyton rubrum MR850]EZF42036.1 hypothetical protein H102_04281 [Trichophyton rubrum CBS 100081]EZF52646.1 hypothetical protein H103_04289 [Trichophyton rubrum CBS 288.86]EZF63242.1 hypothetical protein H104_04279 [Trichophyton rubrum CBS 289.86]EZF84577.1 hypothetical protein H110_04284 [Trichophyton rubrum MR1448]EZF95259.1 hypothetical protein H113_04323 [Trichophyton rubr